MRVGGSRGSNSALHAVGYRFRRLRHSCHGRGLRCSCAELQDNNLSELVREIIAERIIDAAKRGERDPKRLCRIGIAAMNGGPQTREDRPSWQRAVPNSEARDQ